MSTNNVNSSIATENTQLELVKSTITVPGIGSPVLANPPEPIQVKKAPSLADLIADDAKANIELPNEIKEYQENGLFNPTAGMLHIVNKFDGAFYAKLIVNAQDKREIHYIQSYNNGEYSPEYSINQEDLIKLVIWGKSKDPKFIKNSEKIFDKLLTDYLSRCDGRMDLDSFHQLFDVLYEILPQLPLERQNQEVSPEVLYNDVIQALKTDPHYSQIQKEYRNGGYFMLIDYDIDHIAREINISEKRLLELLKKHGFLYLTDSCVGYQAKVAYEVDETTGKRKYSWFYCLYDLAYLNQQQTVNQTKTSKN